jgi:hypothetical protein
MILICQERQIDSKLSLTILKFPRESIINGLTMIRYIIATVVYRQDSLEVTLSFGDCSLGYPFSSRP